jgi:hypothetical protein
MSFATGEDVMRTVESIISDLARSLNSDFSVVQEGEDVFLVPNKTLVCEPAVGWRMFRSNGSGRRRQFKRMPTRLPAIVCHHILACHTKRL